ncbi:helix-turn-helix transcriptional regulator [Saccharopolyspora taberi]|uniref:HTH cro/C1-type domain-containing protein n=1 Tax=Saccharopolyspora taberi TaxID=60895 RepID=A0ABN3V1B3_9PSEU
MLKHPDGWLELQVIRSKDGLSLQALSRLTSVSVGHLSDLEQGKRQPTPPIIKRIALALNVPVSVLEPSPRDEDEISHRVDVARDAA